MSLNVLQVALAVAMLAATTQAQTMTTRTPVKYEPTLASLDTHPLPQWYANAKLGIFVHWGLYSVPGWAPLSHKTHDFASPDYIRDNPYAEWYYNVMRIAGTPTEAYHRQHFGADFNYYDFARTFNAETRTWNADLMANAFRDAGARYVVLTTKHHDGFTLWPSTVPNPNQKNLQASRDLVGDLKTAVEKAGLRMGLYYSGGYDWTFNRGPIETEADYAAVKPESLAYGKYADAQIEELIARYHPAVLWNDIDWPKSGKPLQIMADFYNAVPDGVVDDRFGVKHSDFKSPEYSKLEDISPTKWEECRGLGQSFGYNRAEGEGETIAPDELIYLLVDIVSKNGNLLLDVGPEANGTIPPVQLERLQALGAWMKQNGEAIYGTTPWTHASGTTGAGLNVRFTRKGSSVYATVLGVPKTSAVVLRAVKPAIDSKIVLLGQTEPLPWTQQGPNVEVTLPKTLPGKYAYVFKFQPAV